MMARTDIHLDAMLRHLGAAYYESLHGRATRSDVYRALDTVEEHLHEQGAKPARSNPPPVHHDDGTRHRRWARRVSDVMTTSVVTVDRITSYQEIDRLLTERRISGVPVLKMGRHVVGVVSDELPLADPGDIIVAVKHGVVTLTGTVRPGLDGDEPLLPLTLRLIWDIDGVVDVVNQLGEARPSEPAKTA
jgi:CBS domain-containing protein